jgi:hypothetical protein
MDDSDGGPGNRVHTSSSLQHFWQEIRKGVAVGAVQKT